MTGALNDTIVAVSSASSGPRVIVRISGPGTVEAVDGFFSPAPEQWNGGIYSGKVAVDAELSVEAAVYFFRRPHSYTGEDLAEVHIESNAAVAEALVGGLLAGGLRIAGPGEFTARAYLNGKLDLAQAEAVNEIIVSSNRFQLEAAEKLLSGKLSEMTGRICGEIIESLSLIEAGLDFSGEQIAFAGQGEMVERLEGIRGSLEGLLAGSISYESVIDLPSVGIAGGPNAGKSSLLNRMLGIERSIVSVQRKTTRDVLTGVMSLEHFRCVLFDCAGLLAEPETILDQLAQRAAVEALGNAAVIVFCVDADKENWDEDVAIRRLIENESKAERVVTIATKADLLGRGQLEEKTKQLGELFGSQVLAVSSESGQGFSKLEKIIDKKLIEQGIGAAGEGAIGLTARHRQAVTEAIEVVSDVGSEVDAGNDEVAAMLLRGACEAISNIEQVSIDEKVLDNIFSKFCIGK